MKVAEELAALLRERQWMLATAESCTGGMIAAACTDLPGSSEWFDCGMVSYSYESKSELLGVDATLLQTHGAVSEVVARAMAFGAVRRSRARAAVAVTGIAGPGGGLPNKPVGTVWFAFMIEGVLTSEVRRFDGDRAGVRQATVQHALEGLVRRIRESPAST